MKRYSIIALLLALLLSLGGCVIEDYSADDSSKSISDISGEASSEPTEASLPNGPIDDQSKADESSEAPSNPATERVDLASIPEFSGNPYVVINNNIPSFSESELTTEAYEYYSPLDGKGRCGVVIASLGKELMPDGERGEIGSVKPTGWHTVKYDCVNGKYLYNRCHLIGWQLSGENANVKNLITGTRYMNVEGMLPFENMVADYIKETDNHVAYRVTPIFDGDNLLASGVQIEAYSIEDEGDGICFNVYCYNAQPSIVIDYSNGDSYQSEADTSESETSETSKEEVSKEPENSITYILNTKTKKFHRTTCSSLPTTNREDSELSREELIELGYDPCGRCHP